MQDYRRPKLNIFTFRVLIEIHKACSLQYRLSHGAEIKLWVFFFTRGIKTLSTDFPIVYYTSGACLAYFRPERIESLSLATLSQPGWPAFFCRYKLLISKRMFGMGSSQLIFMECFMKFGQLF